MPLPEFDSGVGWSFGLEFDGVMIKDIQEVSGLKFEQDVVELKQNTTKGKYMVKKLPGTFKPGEVTLTRGLTGDDSFEKWMKNAMKGDMKMSRKGGAVVVYDFTGVPLKRYKFTNAWPKSLEVGSFKAGDSSVMTEKLTLTYEDLEVDKT
jgi:phage tail-like protein